jgi:hypothetical protein
VKEDVISFMRTVEPNYNEWSDIEILEQIKALDECGYEWVRKGGRGGFKHRDSGVYLKIRGLNYYPPEKLKETYRNVWSEDFEGVIARTHLTKVFRSILLFIPSSIIILILYSFRVTIPILALFIIYISYHYYKYRRYIKVNQRRKIEKEKKDGTYVDVKEIQWCSNCIHFRKVNGWLYDNIHMSEYLIPEENIPCKIFLNTIDVWKSFFSGKLNDRYLYPKNCNAFVKK